MTRRRWSETGPAGHGRRWCAQSFYQWTRVSFDGPPRSDWTPPHLSALAPRARSRGADVTWRMADRAASTDWFMVGDAAATLDPTSSHGVLKAIISGMTAGHLDRRPSSADRAPAEEAAAAYHDWFAGWFSTDAANLTKFYDQLLGLGKGHSFADFRSRREATPHFPNSRARLP